LRRLQIRRSPVPVRLRSRRRSGATLVKGAGGATGGDDLRDRGEADKRDDKNDQTKRRRAVGARPARPRDQRSQANNCKEASSLALALSNRAPGYYQQNVENDRTLKQCMTYINAAREQEAERQQRARALQKRNADEAKRPAPAADKPANSASSYCIHLADRERRGPQCRARR